LRFLPIALLILYGGKQKVGLGVFGVVLDGFKAIASAEEWGPSQFYGASTDSHGLACHSI